MDFAPPDGFNNDFYFHPIGIDDYSNPIQEQTGEVSDSSPLSWMIRRSTLFEKASKAISGCSVATKNCKNSSRSLWATSPPHRLSDLVVEGESLTQVQDGEGEPLLQELHAKLFIYRRNGRSHAWFLGSANATKAALERNVEFLLELRGQGKSIQLEQVLDDLLGADRTKTVFEEFEPPKVVPDDDAERQLERQLRRLEYDLLTELEIVRAEVVDVRNGTNYDLHRKLPSEPSPGSTST